MTFEEFKQITKDNKLVSLENKIKWYELEQEFFDLHELERKGQKKSKVSMNRKKRMLEIAKEINEIMKAKDR